MPTKASKAAARDGDCPCNLGVQGCGKAEGYNVSCVEAAPKKSGENDSIRFELWRKCVEKLGSGLRAADRKRLCTVETYPSASATTTFQPQVGGECAPISPHPRCWKTGCAGVLFERLVSVARLCATWATGAGDLLAVRDERRFPGWRGERLMRGSGRAWSSPEVFPWSAIQYVTIARLRIRSLLSVEKKRVSPPC